MRPETAAHRHSVIWIHTNTPTPHRPLPNPQSGGMLQILPRKPLHKHHHKREIPRPARHLAPVLRCLCKLSGGKRLLRRNRCNHPRTHALDQTHTPRIQPGHIHSQRDKRSHWHTNSRQPESRPPTPFTDTQRHPAAHTERIRHILRSPPLRAQRPLAAGRRRCHNHRQHHGPMLRDAPLTVTSRSRIGPVTGPFRIHLTGKACAGIFQSRRIQNINKAAKLSTSSYPYTDSACASLRYEASHPYLSPRHGACTDAHSSSPAPSSHPQCRR